MRLYTRARVAPLASLQQRSPGCQQQENRTQGDKGGAHATSGERSSARDLLLLAEASKVPPRRVVVLHQPQRLTERAGGAELAAEAARGGGDRAEERARGTGGAALA